MKTQAAVLVETGKPLEIVELEIPQLKPGQTLVEIEFSGVCHTQVLECRGHKGKDPYCPHCLGHEGSGVVRETGEGVTRVKSGDRVLLSWMKAGGKDVPGSVYTWDGKNVNAGGVTTFSKYSVVSENRLTLLPNDIPSRDAALLGCAVPTGFGVIFNTAQAKPGSSVVVFGAGGIGLCAVAAASIAGCSPVIAVDILPEKLKLAKIMGATNTFSAAEGKVEEQIKELCKGGVDIAIEATGRPAVMVQALACVRPQGGVAVVVGNAHHDEFMQLDPRQLNMGKQLRGTWGGDNVPDRDFPKYFEFLTSGKFKLEPLLDRTYGLADINGAIDDLEAGRVARPLIDLSL